LRAFENQAKKAQKEEDRKIKAAERK